MNAPKPTQLQETIAESQANAKAAAERLVKTFSFVPDDKLNWSPSKTARSSLTIVAHCIMANRMFAKVIRGEAISPMPTADQMHAASRQFEATITDRSEAVRQLGASNDEVIAALGTVTAERFGSSPNSPFGPLPMPFWMSLPGMHMGTHAAQIDYIETIWGDLDDHM